MPSEAVLSCMFCMVLSRACAIEKGKTMLSASVARRDETRRFFSSICWVSLGQEPQLPALQIRCFEQLSDAACSGETTTVQRRCDELKKAASGRTVLIVNVFLVLNNNLQQSVRLCTCNEQVLDDVWDRKQ